MLHAHARRITALAKDAAAGRLTFVPHTCFQLQLHSKVLYKNLLNKQIEAWVNAVRQGSMYVPYINIMPASCFAEATQKGHGFSSQNLQGPPSRVVSMAQEHRFPMGGGAFCPRTC